MGCRLNAGGTYGLVLHKRAPQVGPAGHVAREWMSQRLQVEVAAKDFGSRFVAVDVMNRFGQLAGNGHHLDF